MSNYLTQILRDTGIKEDKDITLINCMVTLWQYIVALGVTVVIDRFKRRTFFLTGSGGVLVTFVAWTIAAQQYLEHDSIAAGRVVLACIFLFQGFYTCAWTNLIVTYPLELVTYQMRAKTWAFVLLTIQVASIFGGYVNPVGLENIGWKFTSIIAYGWPLSLGLCTSTSWRRLGLHWRSWRICLKARRVWSGTFRRSRWCKKSMRS